MECNDLVPQNIVSRSQVGGNLDRPGETICNEDIGPPLPALERHVNQSANTDLEEFQLRLVCILAITRALGQVVNNRSFVRLGPCVPFQVDLVSRLYSDMTSRCLGTLMADNIRFTEAVRLNVTIICSPNGPANYWVMVGIPREGRSIVASVSHAVGNEPVNMSVRGNIGDRGHNGNKGGYFDDSHCMC